MPPFNLCKTDIAVRGPQKGVDAAVAELKAMVQLKSSKCTTVTLKVEKKHHRFVIGNRGKSIQDVLEQHDVIVEVPALDSNSEDVVLRGEPLALGNALTAVTLVIANAKQQIQKESMLKFKNIFDSGKAKHDMRKKLTPYRKQKQTSILPLKPTWLPHDGVGKKPHDRFPNVNISIPDENSKSDERSIRGPSKELAAGRKADCEAAQEDIRKIEKELGEIKETTVENESKLRQALIGADGKLAKKRKGDDCVIHSPSDESDQVTIRGKSKAVKVTKKVSEDEAGQVRLESFTAKIDVDPSLHRFLIDKNDSKFKDIW